MRKPYHDFFRLKLNRGIYHVIFRDRPDRQISTGCTDENAAISWAYEHLESPASTVTLRTFSKDFFIPGKCPYARRMEKRKRTFADTYYQDLKSWKDNYIIPKWGSYRISSIRKREVEEWLFDVTGIRTRKALVNESKNKILDCFRKILEEAVDSNLIQANPLTRLALFPPDGEPTEPFTKEECEAFFPPDRKQCLYIWGSENWYAYFLTMYMTGWRPGEVAALKPDLWYRSEQAIVARRNITKKRELKDSIKTSKKGMKFKVAFIPHRLQQELLLLEPKIANPDGLFFSVNNRPIETNSANKHLRLSAPRAEVDLRDRTQYSFRHAFATDLHVVAPENIVNSLMGHTKYRAEYDRRDEVKMIETLKGAGVPDLVQSIRGS